MLKLQGSPLGGAQDIKRSKHPTHRTSLDSCEPSYSCLYSLCVRPMNSLLSLLSRSLSSCDRIYCRDALQSAPHPEQWSPSTLLPLPQPLPRYHVPHQKCLPPAEPLCSGKSCSSALVWMDICAHILRNSSDGQHEDKHVCSRHYIHIDPGVCIS